MKANGYSIEYSVTVWQKFVFTFHLRSVDIEVRPRRHPKLTQKNTFTLSTLLPLFLAQILRFFFLLLLTDFIILNNNKNYMVTRENFRVNRRWRWRNFQKLPNLWFSTRYFREQTSLNTQFQKINIFIRL